MKSSAIGKNISNVEVQDITQHGVWLFIKRAEYFLPFKDFPWFKDAKLSEIHNVRLLHSRHLHWPALDVDLELEALRHPEQYPLIYE